MEKNSVNKILLVGRLGARPLSRYTKQGKASASFSIATNEIWKDADGQPCEHVEWHQIVCWDKLADFAGQYLQKGQLVYVEGSLRSRTWKDKEGLEKKIIEVFCSKLTLLEQLPKNQ